MKLKGLGFRGKSLTLTDQNSEAWIPMVEKTEFLWNLPNEG